jgi:peptidoglycan hydrolase-like protein with peptidoglycan-binding domain
VGSRGESVAVVQRALNDISARYPAIPTLNADGVFGPLTQASVIAFQRIFGLNPDGVVGPLTWGMLVRVLTEWSSVPVPLPYPGELLRVGSRGNDVMNVQRLLNQISARNPSIPTLAEDGVFGPRTEASVIAFQRAYAIADNGIVGPVTWAWLTSVANSLRFVIGSAAMVESASVTPLAVGLPMLEKQDVLPLMMLMMYGLNR